MSSRRIALYIDGQRADMTADSLVLMNYTASDLSNPAAVKNSYSQQATLPATLNNDKIFASIYRADWRAGNNTTFNPLVRTPFAIYDDSGEMLESGYLKLNKTTNKNGVRTYVVTLYGGLGSFFYSLSYDEQGNGLSLGDLPLLGNDSAHQIDFIINAQAVSNAWNRLKKKTVANVKDKQFDVVNFAPAYNGLPVGEFDASKGVGNPALVGGETTAKDDQGNTYKTYGENNDALYDFGGDFTEWETKDLRSYMQRPVVSVKALIEGIVRYGAARGFTVKLDPTWFSLQNPYYNRAWMTLQLLAGRSVPNKEEGVVEVSGKGNIGGRPTDTRYLYIPLTPAISTINANVTVRCRPQIMVWTTFNSFPSIAFNGYSIATTFGREQGIVVFVQVQLLDKDGNVVNASSIKVCASATYPGLTEPEQWVAQADLQACVDPDNVGKLYIGLLNRIPEYSTEDYSGFGFDGLDEVSLTAYQAVSARICIESRAITYTREAGRTLSKTTQLYCPNHAGGNPTFNIVWTWGARVVDGTLEYETANEYRSGARVTQKDLFADTMSPMEFLLSYSKTFGLHYLYDHTRKQVEIVTRNTLYGGRKTIDLQQRIDRSREITTNPIPTSAKWLEFAPENIEGEFPSYYKSKYGRQYGIQTVNTGYEFDANTTKVLDNGKFNGGAEVLERSKYYLYVKNSSRSRIPAPVIDSKTTYKLFRVVDGEFQGHEMDYPNLTLPEAEFEGFEYFNANKGYDGVPKLQCHGADNSGTEGAGILLFHRGLASQDPSTGGDAIAQAAYKGFLITDDSAAMYALNGKPCWELSTGEDAGNMPAFGRFDMKSIVIKQSMEFGLPAEIDNPVIAVDENTTVYERFWAAYIGDRNDVNTRTCTAYVDLRELKPGPEMLREFYYFDGAIWVMNKIANYSISSPGTTQCEFIKVQDLANYTAGQIFAKDGMPIALSLRTDGTDLYVATSQPLKKGEYIAIMTRGAGRMAWYTGTPGRKRDYSRSKRRWHVPYSSVDVGADGKITLDDMYRYPACQWYIKTDKRGRKFVHIKKANYSTGFGYKAVEGLEKAVTFAVVVVSKEYPPVELSNRCYFESRCRFRNGTLEQEFVTSE